MGSGSRAGKGRERLERRAHLIGERRVDRDPSVEGVEGGQRADQPGGSETQPACPSGDRVAVGGGVFDDLGQPADFGQQGAALVVELGLRATRGRLVRLGKNMADQGRAGIAYQSGGDAAEARRRPDVGQQEHQGCGQDPDRHRREAGERAQEDVFRIGKSRAADDDDRVAGEHGSIGLEEAQQRRGDAGDADADREGHREQNRALGERGHHQHRRGGADEGAEQAPDALGDQRAGHRGWRRSAR